ncbi:MAG: hypothetical protein ACLP00_25875 [Terracidiphilus sp.]
MGSTTKEIGREGIDGDPRTFDEVERTAVLHELDAILNSPVFQPSKRCKQFLSYVVRQRLEGNDERLKERTIGVDLFQRPTEYATGDDPVVRVQAGEVRRRLDKYYQTTPNNSPVRIELHVGTYTPEFKWARPAPQPGDPSALQSGPEIQEATHLIGSVQESAEVASPPLPETKRTAAKQKRLLWIWSAVGIALLAGLALIGSTIYRARTRQSALQSFWAPALSSPEPILICLAKPSVYLPSIELYQRHSKTPDKFLDPFERLSQRPDLQPDDKLVWSDMVELPDYGVAAGDVYTAVRLSSLFGQIGKKNQVRIGGNYSFEDLRNSPDVIIGAYNNPWAMKMTSNLHFSFTSEGTRPFIREEGLNGRRWYSKLDSNGRATEDYAVVTRLLTSRTGQFVVIVAGIKSYSTQAAGEFVTNPAYLQAGFQSVSPDWEKKNVQLILETPVTDGLPGAPQVVASYVW